MGRRDIYDIEGFEPFEITALTPRPLCIFETPLTSFSMS